MASAENRRRKKDRRKSGDDSLWGSLLRRSSEDTAGGNVFRSEEYADRENAEESSALRELWHKLNFWSLTATALFLLFTGGLIYTTAKMWQPQDMKGIAGYTDKGAARDISVALHNANGAEIVFTEGEINRYLRDTCRLRQTGIFSVLAHPQGVAVRIHDGYVELLIDRVLSTHLHQTTAVNLSFVQVFDHGRPTLRVEFRGGEPLMGSMPQGGSVGQVGVPQRYMQMLRPALETMVDCYPDIVETVIAYGYRPEFIRGRNGQESYMRLIPYSPSHL